MSSGASRRADCSRLVRTLVFVNASEGDWATLGLAFLMMS